MLGSELKDRIEGLRKKYSKVLELNNMDFDDLLSSRLTTGEIKTLDRRHDLGIEDHIVKRVKLLDISLGNLSRLCTEYGKNTPYEQLNRALSNMDDELRLISIKKLAAIWSMEYIKIISQRLSRVSDNILKIAQEVYCISPDEQSIDGGYMYIKYSGLYTSSGVRIYSVLLLSEMLLKIIDRDIEIESEILLGELKREDKIISIAQLIRMLGANQIIWAVDINTTDKSCWPFENNLIQYLANKLSEYEFNYNTLLKLDLIGTDKYKGYNFNEAILLTILNHALQKYT